MMRVIDRPPMTEAELLANIKAAAKEWGWLAFHNRYSIGSDPGWPDLVLVKDGLLLAWEVKGNRGKLSPAQEAWLASLAQVPGVDARVVREADLEECYRIISLN